MAIFALVLFVAGSLFFSLWAWRSYDTMPRKEEVAQDETGPLVIVSVIALLGGGLLELLRHYTKLPFTLRIAISVAAITLAQYLAFRVLDRFRRKTQDGHMPVPPLSRPQS